MRGVGPGALLLLLLIALLLPETRAGECGVGRERPLRGGDRPGVWGAGPQGRGDPDVPAQKPPSPRVPACPSLASRPLFSTPFEVRTGFRPLPSHWPYTPSALPAASPRTRDPRREEVGPRLTPPRPQAPTPCGISSPPCPGPAVGSPASSPSATWTTRSSCGSTATPRNRGWSRGRGGRSRRGPSIGIRRRRELRTPHRLSN